MASATSRWAQPRTCTTLPGAEPSSGSAMAWMLSITTSVGLELVDRREDVRQRRLGQHPHVAVVGEAEPPGAQAHLLGALLGADVQRAPGPADGQLGEQGALADPRLATEQRDRAGHQPAAEHTVQLADARRRRTTDEHVDVGTAGSASRHGVAAVAAGQVRHSSASVFHAEHAGHRPLHFGWASPHSEQRWTSRALDMAGTVRRGSHSGAESGAGAPERRSPGAGLPRRTPRTSRAPSHRAVPGRRAAATAPVRRGLGHADVRRVSLDELHAFLAEHG